MNAVDIMERTVSISWDQIVRWTALAAAVLIAKAMAAALVTTRRTPLLMPVHQDNAAPVRI